MNSGDETVGMVGIIVLLVILFVSYYSGGYVAGRMARFHGARQGIAVWGWAVVIAMGLTVVMALYNPFDGSVSVTFDPLTDAAARVGVH